MSDPLDRLALAETPDDVAAVLAEAPHLADAAARWQAVRAAVRADLAVDLPDADLLVLRAVDPADLTDAEQARLDAARPALDAALARHPGLAAAAGRVSGDREAFEELWQKNAASPSPATSRHSHAAPRRAEGADDRPARPAPRRGNARWVWRTAALAGVAVFAVVATSVARRDAGFETITAQTAQTVTLADGSVAELAAGTVLMVPKEGHGSVRQARLRSGDALFQVVHDPARPFTVETPNADVTVLGTVFAVRVADAETGRVQTDVTLLSGRVDVALRGGPAVRLAPGQGSRVVALQSPTPPAAADLGEALAWAGDVVVRDEPARTVAARLSGLFGTEITVDDALAAERVSASFRLADGPGAAVEALALALGGRVEATGRGRRIVAE